MKAAIGFIAGVALAGGVFGGAFFHYTEMEAQQDRYERELDDMRNRVIQANVAQQTIDRVIREENLKLLDQYGCNTPQCALEKDRLRRICNR